MSIHDEWKRNLLQNRPDITAEQLNRTSALMDRAIPDALVTGHEGLVAGLNPALDTDSYLDVLRRQGLVQTAKALVTYQAIL